MDSRAAKTLAEYAQAINRADREIARIEDAGGGRADRADGLRGAVEQMHVPSAVCWLPAPVV